MAVPNPSSGSVQGFASPTAQLAPSTDTIPAAKATLAASYTTRESAGPVSLAGNAPAHRPNSRDAILDAAESVAADSGAAHMTLDAVAERAGISKGGLLYNFRTKEALLEAMLDRHMRHLEAVQFQALAALPPGPGRGLKALIHLLNSPCLETDQRSSCSTLAAVAHNPRLLEPIRAAKRRRIERLTAPDGQNGDAPLSFARTAAIALAVDGLCLQEILQVSPYTADERQQIVDDLLRLVDEAASAVISPSEPQP